MNSLHEILSIQGSTMQYVSMLVDIEITVIGPHILNESQSVDFTVPVHVYIYI